MLATKFASVGTALCATLAVMSYAQTVEAADPPAAAQATQQAGQQPAQQPAQQSSQQPADKAAQAEKKITDALATLAPADRKLAETQRFCAVTEHSRLGSMGTPVKIVIEGKPVFLCCKGCLAEATEGGKQTLQKAEKLRKASAELAKLPAADRALAESQKYCAIAEGSLLGGMGAPIKLVVDGKPVFLCCQGCVRKAQANPAATLAKVEELRKAAAAH